MDIITVFLSDRSTVTVATSSWYHKPKILSAIAFQLEYFLRSKILFVASSKYGCRQFLPYQSISFPVNGFDKCDYKEGLPWLTPEFNDCAKDKPRFDPSKLDFIDPFDDLPF